MLVYIIAGALAIDALATGVFIGKKWATGQLTAVMTKAGQDLALAQAKAKQLEAAIVTPVTPVSPTPTQAALAAQAATAPKP